MAEFSIVYNGRHYQYDRYRYDHLADAVNYARLRRLVPPDKDEEADAMPAPEDVQPPDEAQRQLMSEFDISYEHGLYRFGPFRYERCSDAVAYARLERGRGGGSQPAGHPQR
ncbi:hypothetical protein AAW51_1918 [Caldimonas brevitalea]|uniref:Uncharacterized protein n=2 Tax=Caldimonas brevitalea TaxID=413882 RepID=A0A0G3BGN5_9BURK|nr:hypothetical protein AAW51_1918 [Caldimonas brevitalea]